MGLATATDWKMIIDGQEVETLQGATLTVGVDGSDVTLTDAAGNTVNVTQTDVEARPRMAGLCGDGDQRLRSSETGAVQRNSEPFGEAVSCSSTLSGQVATWARKAGSATTPPIW